MAERPFWKKPLAELTTAEWEALCDGCGKCCLVKLRCADTDRVYFTDVACKLLDTRTCRCGDYAARTRLVPDCVVLDKDTVGSLDWLPQSCAYRRRAEGRDLAWWHPLVSGDPESVHRAGISVRDRIVSEGDVSETELEDRLVDWPDRPPRSAGRRPPTACRRRVIRRSIKA